MKRATKGHGSVTQLSNGKWIVKVPVGKHSSGATRYVTETHPTKTLANRARLRLLTQRENQTMVAGPRVTLHQYATEVLQGRNDHVSERTLDGYYRNLRKHVFPVVGGKALADVRPFELERLLQSIRREYSASTVNNIRIGLSKVFSEAMRHGLVPTNPVSGTQKARRQEWESTQVRVPWTVAEVRRVCAVIDDSPLRGILTLALATGMRLGELQGLMWSDLDFETNSLSVERTLSHQSVLKPDGTRRHEVVVRPPKTTSSRRVIQLTRPMMDVLAIHRTEQEVAKAAAGKTWSESGYVFTNIVGGPLDASRLRKRYKRILKEGGIRAIRLHDIRHTFATILIERDGAALPAVSRALGHSSLSITLDTYASTARVENEATSQMSDVLFPGTLNVSPRVESTRRDFK